MGNVKVFKLNGKLVTNRNMTAKEIHEFMERVWIKKNVGGVIIVNKMFGVNLC
jgi:hypothetical protein